MAIDTTPSVTVQRCTFVGGRGRRCDLPREPLNHRHAFNLRHLHGGPDPDLCYSPPNQNERNDMAKQQIVTEKTAPEENETETDSAEAEATGPKYEKYPKDPAQWTPEHDFKAFGDVARILARAPYAARCRMHAYLVGLIAPDHQAEQDRRKDYAAKAYAAERTLNTTGPSDAYAEGPVMASNGMVGDVERRY